jgi:hypothetical protein
VRTSSPTSKCCWLIVGPNHAISSAGRIPDV